MTVPQRAGASAAEIWHSLARERRWIAERSDAVLRAQVEIAGIPAPTGAEQQRAAHVAARFRAIGLTPAVDDAGNVTARAPGAYDAAPVTVCAHLDTVFPAGTPLEARRDGTRLVAPGICDNGRGLAVMLALADVVHASPAGFGRPIEFVATTGEEGAGNLRGARHYFARSRPPHAVIAVDGAGDERIVNTGLGSRRFRVTYRGAGGHSWAAYGVANPLHAATRAAAALADFRASPGMRGHYALSVNRMAGGHSVNSIAEEAWIEVDVRSADESVLARLEREVRELAWSAGVRENDRRAGGTDPLRFSCECIGDRPAGLTAPDAPLVAAAIEATRLVGREPELATASTDANAAMQLGVPAIAIGGGGRGGAAHSTREWFDATDAWVGVERALTIVATMARASYVP